jgi:hypothetical protein
VGRVRFFHEAAVVFITAAYDGQGSLRLHHNFRLLELRLQLLQHASGQTCFTLFFFRFISSAAFFIFLIILFIYLFCNSQEDADRILGGAMLQPHLRHVSGHSKEKDEQVGVQDLPREAVSAQGTTFF